MTTLCVEQPRAVSRVTALVWLELSNGVRHSLHASCVLGRSPSNEVRLTGEKVSRHHAAIQAQGEKDYWLSDLGSRNGTWLNGRLITQATRLCDRDQIRIGPHRLIFREPGGRVRSQPEHSIADLAVGDFGTSYCWLLLGNLKTDSGLDERLPPHQSSAWISRWLDQCAELVEDYTGHISRYLGDGFLACWPDSDGHRAALAGALSELKHLQARAQTPFQVALHFGQVHFRQTALGEEDLSGPAVTFILRVAKLASSLNLPNLVSKAAQALLRSHITFREAGRYSLAGFESKEPFYRF